MGRDGEGWGEMGRDVRVGEGWGEMGRDGERSVLQLSHV